jgi:hypothetical protein
MSLTRKFLKAMELDDDKISQIIDAHQATIDEIAGERDKFKAEAEKFKADSEKLSSVEKDLLKAEAKLEDAEKVSKKYDALKEEFDNYKNDVDAKATQLAKEKAYKEVLREAGVSEKRFDSIVKVSDLSGIELDEEGKVKDSAKLLETVKSEWADFIVTGGKQGADVSNPPASTGGSAFEQMSLAEKMAYANENPDNAEVQAWLK